MSNPLNAEQRMAVEHGQGHLSGAGPLLVIAGAGTGKTATLAHRVAWLVANGIPVERILLMTFSRRAAAEMVRRAGALLAADRKRTDTKRSVQASTLAPCEDPLQFRLPWSGTFHSVAAQLLRRYAHLLELNPAFTIIDRADAIDCLDWLRSEMALDQSTSRFPRASTCLSIYSDRINTGAELDDVLGARYPWCVQWREPINRLLHDYVQHKQAQALLDYDDLLLWWRLGMDDAGFAQQVGRHFDHVLVDEYQDSNRLQVQLLAALRPDGRGLFVVGDDAQAIYSFRGADVDHIYRFSGQFSPPARRVALSTNYRSTQPVLDTANALIAAANGPFDKSLVASDTSAGVRPRLVTVLDDMAQAAWVVARVLEQRESGVPLREQAVLFRNAQHSDTLEIALTQHNIPFIKYGGLRFVEGAHIKDAVALLRWSVNPRDVLAGFRVLQLLDGVGPAIARAVLRHMAGAPLRDLSPAATYARMAGTPPADLANEQGAGLLGVMQQLTAGSASVRDRVTALGQWLGPVLLQRYPDPEPRAADLQVLAGIAAGHADLPSLIEALALEPPGATGGWGDDALIDDDYLILSTVHSAKGQEWRNVMVINVADGNFPNEFSTGNARALEEERRLLYVAMTRAKRQLDLIEPQRYYVTQQARHGGAHVYGARSRFLDARVLATLDAVAATDRPEGRSRNGAQTASADGSGDESASTGAQQSVSLTQPRSDVALRIQSYWTIAGVNKKN